MMLFIFSISACKQDVNPSLEENSVIILKYEMSNSRGYYEVPLDVKVDNGKYTFHSNQLSQVVTKNKETNEDVVFFKLTDDSQKRITNNSFKCADTGIYTGYAFHTKSGCFIYGTLVIDSNCESIFWPCTSCIAMPPVCGFETVV